VARSTVYRYFATRDELLLGLVLARADAALTRWVAALRHPRDAASSIRELLLEPVAAVNEGDALNRALYSSESTALASALEAGAEPIVDLLARHIQPLFEMWMADGQLHSDLDLRETVQWMSATATFLLAPSWRQRPIAAKRRFIDRYLLRALLQAQPTD
jgi:TetR/AcrR family transcriptional regulator